MWVAKNKNNCVILFISKPIRNTEFGIWYSKDMFMEIPEKEFPYLEWESEPVEIKLTSIIDEEIIKHTSVGVSNKEMQELLSEYPDDSKVVVECCNVKYMKYCKEDNTIRID